MSQTQVLPIEYSDEKTEKSDVLKVVGYIIVGEDKFDIKNGSNNIGRDPQICNIVLSNKTVSKLHLVIECESLNDIFIYDNGSTNKTMLGKTYLKPHCRYKLEHNNLITIGNVKMKFVLLLSNRQTHHQYLELENPGSNSINLNSIFDAETQFKITQKEIPPTMSPNRKITHSDSSVNSKSASAIANHTQPATALIIHQEKVIEEFHEKGLNNQNSQNKLKSPKNYQTCLGKMENSNIFDVETQCPSNSVSKTQVINHKEITQPVTCSEVVQVSLTENYLKSSGDHPENRTVISPSRLQVQDHKSVFRSGNSAEEEKELLINDLKLIKGFEENFDLEDGKTTVQNNKTTKKFESQEQESNQWKSKSPDKSPMEMGVLEKNNMTDVVMHNKTENKILQNIDTVIPADCIGNYEIHEANKVEIKMPHRNSIPHSSSSDENNDKSDSDSYLEITLDGDGNENFQVGSMVNKNFSATPVTREKEVLENQFCERRNELNLQCISNRGFKSQLGTFQNVMENENAPIIKSPTDVQFDLVLGENKGDEVAGSGSDLFSTSSPSLFPTSVSPKDTQDFIDTNLMCSQKLKIELACKLNQKAEVRPIDCNSIDKDDSTPIILTRNISSCVRESSDEDNTLSDLEIIDDSPYYQRGRITSQYASLKRVVSNSLSRRKLIYSSPIQNEDVKFTKRKLSTDSESSNQSDSSYVFDIFRDNENLKQNFCAEDKGIKNNTLRDSMLSDSDSSDVIDMTPPQVKWPSFNTKSSGLQRNTTVDNEAVLNTSKTVHEFSDYGSFAALVLPSSEVLENTLKKIVERGTKLMKMKEENSKENSGNSRMELATETILGSTPGKRIRNSNTTEGVPMKKTKITSSKDEMVDIDWRNDLPSSKLLGCSEDVQVQDVEKNNLRATGCTSSISSTGNSNAFKKALQKENQVQKTPASTRLTRSKTKQNPQICLEQLEPSHPATKNSERKEKNEFGISINGACRSLIFTNGASREKMKTKNRATKDSSVDENLIENSFKIAFTGFDSVCLEKIIQELGGEKTENLNSAHVLITDQIRRTVKFLCAIGLSIPIVSPKWLLESQMKKSFLNPWNYILKCEESEAKWNFNLKLALEKSKEKKLLEGFSVFATDNVKPPVDDILYIVECCGGIPLRDKPKIWTKQMIVISCPEDKKLWPPWKYRFIKIVHYEFILSGVLQQNLDFKTFKLR